MKNVFKQNIIRYNFTTKKNCIEIIAGDFSSADEMMDRTAELLASEAVIVLFDGSAYSDKDFMNIGEKIRLLCAEYNSILIIKSRTDIAYLLGAEGVCLSNRDFSPLQAHEITGEKLLIGTIDADEENSKYPVDFRINNGILSSIVIDNKIPVRKL